MIVDVAATSADTAAATAAAGGENLSLEQTTEVQNDVSTSIESNILSTKITRWPFLHFWSQNLKLLLLNHFGLEEAGILSSDSLDSWRWYSQVCILRTANWKV